MVVLGNLSGLLAQVLGVVTWLLVTAIASILGSGIFWKWLVGRNIEVLKADLRRENDEKIERLKSDLKQSNEVQLEAIKSDLRRAEDALRTRNKWLHEERAKVIIDLYASIVDLESASVALTSPNYIGPTDPDSMDADRKRRFQRVAETGNAYRERYPKDLIFFDEDVASKLRDLDNLFWGKYIMMNLYGRDPATATRDDIEQWMKAADYRAVSAIMGDLKRKLQSLLGVEMDA